jgi:predicted ATP-grasp superfamily ATP-dependent carboligase
MKRSRGREQVGEEPLSAQCNIRFTPSEMAELKQLAADAGITVSDYVRRRTLGKRVVANTDLAMLRELRRVGGLLKHIHVESGGAYSQLTSDALETVREAMERIGNGG